jgi:hypothetical protein
MSEGRGETTLTQQPLDPIPGDLITEARIINVHTGAPINPATNRSRV